MFSWGCALAVSTAGRPRALESTARALSFVQESMTGHFVQAWIEPGGLGELFGQALPPAYIAAACCASFAVTREAVLRRPLAFYQGLRNWLLRTTMEKYWAGLGRCHFCVVRRRRFAPRAAR
jgi:hypothetical protein